MKQAVVYQANAVVPTLTIASRSVDTGPWAGGDQRGSDRTTLKYAMSTVSLSERVAPILKAVAT